MLHYYLEKYSNLVYYDAVCKRLLTFGQSVPDYIESAFKKINLSSLINLYVNYGLNEQALEILVEHIDNVCQNMSSQSQRQSVSCQLSNPAFFTGQNLIFDHSTAQLVRKHSTLHLHRSIVLFLEQDQQQEPH